jgi:hypothetical protein
MTILLRSDGKGLRLEVSINWRSLRSLVKALLLLISTVITFLATPQIHRLGVILGLW